MITVDWKNPSTVPEVAPGTEEIFWIAVQHKDGKITTCHALYQNRPLVDEEHELYSDCLRNTDGEAVESIGWVEDQVHIEFDNFYTPFDFDDECKLVGWAEYEFPEFGVSSNLTLKAVKASAVQDFAGVLVGAIESNFVCDLKDMTNDVFLAIAQDHANDIRKA